MTTETTQPYTWDHPSQHSDYAVVRSQPGGGVMAVYSQGGSRATNGTTAAAHCNRLNGICPKCNEPTRTLGMYVTCDACHWTACADGGPIRNDCWVNERDTASDFRPEPDDGISDATVADIIAVLSIAATSCDCGRCFAARAVADPSYVAPRRLCGGAHVPGLLCGVCGHVA